MHIFAVTLEHGMAITFCANIISLAARVLLDAIRVAHGVCADSLKPVKLARHFRNMNLLHGMPLLSD